MELREYQQEAVNAIYQYCGNNRDKNPIVILPTGAGKTIVLAQLCLDTVKRWNQRVLIVTHQKELLVQAADKLSSIGIDDIGIFCASLNEKRTDASVTLASIQSCCRYAKKLNESGSIALVIVDEAHRIPMNSEGQYGEFFDSQKQFNPNTRIVGLTATPYRYGSGLIYGEGRLFDDVCYEKPVRELIESGYLSPLVSFAGKDAPDVSRISIKHGEFNPKETEVVFTDSDFITSAVQDILRKTADRKRILVFCCSIHHAEVVEKLLKENYKRYRSDEVSVDSVHSKLTAEERDFILAQFKGIDKDLFGGTDESAKYLTNVDILTTGFDAPNIDAVILLRPTKSTGLYIQMVGRGLRKCEGKQDCLILDYGGNILRHGPIDRPFSIRQKDEVENPSIRECPSCHCIFDTERTSCPSCGFTPKAKASLEQERPSRERSIKHETISEEAHILSVKQESRVYKVKGWQFTLHKKVNADSTETHSVRLRYSVSLTEYFDMYLCPEHSGYARTRFEEWWRVHSLDPPPSTVIDVVELGNCGALKVTQLISVRPDFRNPRFNIVTELKTGDWFLPADELDEPMCQDCTFFDPETSNNGCMLTTLRVNASTSSCESFQDKSTIPF